MKFNYSRLYFVFAVLIALSLTSVPLLAEGGGGGSQPVFPLRLKDDLGYEIVLEAPPGRIISLAPSNTEILCALGLEDRLVAVTTLCNWPPSVRDKPKVGGLVDFNVEQILAWRADFVFAVRGNPAERLRRLQKMGTPVYAFDCGRLEDIFAAIERVGLICGVSEKAKLLADSLRTRVERVHSAVAGVSPRKRVYVGSIRSPYYTAGRGSFIDEVIELAGGDNIARSAGSRWPILSAEQILVSDPQAVFLGLDYEDAGKMNREKLLEPFQRDPIWSRTSAGRQGALFVLDQDSLHRPAPRLVNRVEEMAKALYPERFSGMESRYP